MADKDTGRVEAFSDGVFAIAITLLILEIQVPRLADVTNRGLFAVLAGLWPSFLAFVLSFFVILIMWINHHELLRLVRRVDYSFLFANGFLLLLVTFVPFPTAVLARYLSTNASNAAAEAYCGTFVLGSIAYILVFESVARRRRLVRPEVGNDVLVRVRRAYYIGLVVYIASVVVARWSAAGGLIISASLWLVWIRLCYHSETERESSQE